MLLRFVTFLAPNMFPVYQFVADCVARHLGCQSILTVGVSFDEFAQDRADVGFICGLPYVQLRRLNAPPVELLAAPALQGDRYAGRPIYFSDVIVRTDSPFGSFADLKGHSWSYNDIDSHSGYNLTRHHLVKIGETRGYFSRVVAAGSHQDSIRLVVAGEVEGSAIDSQVLAIELRDSPALKEHVKTIESFGPSTIQPVVAATRLPESLKRDLRDVLISLGDDDPSAREALGRGFVERFVPVTDAAYDDIRHMIAAAEDIGYLTIA